MICVDRIRSPYVAQACADFRARLRAYYVLEEIEVKAGHGKDPASALRDESRRIARLLRADDRLWLLDRGGRQLSSVALARRIAEAGRSGPARLTFVIGGAFGSDDALRTRAQFVWSLSKLTFLHEWARLLVLEQLYRAAKIARNEPYHH
ncbi:MAG: 23S rRNA (pseudouridine(1915)-N(3))-methyltransferase RlmH [Candidatus Eremiobacteraeota bacterium]|nr:23S rRNA (pseudouridine(1915)-N(3))-methyltransferase RlmH [Candidatus Eremiobacteraeota bacterium]